MAKKKTVNETPRARFGYLLYDEMLLRIEEGKLDSYDVVYTKDTRQCFVITPELEPMAIHSRVYVFGSVNEAVESLNTSNDTYIGQVISILDGEVYRGYIVNKGNDGKYFVTPLYEHPTEIDYDTLGNKPIENKTGTYNNPVILRDLETGLYNVVGKYKITSTENVSASINGNQLKITATGIGDAKVNLALKDTKYELPPIVYFSDHSQNVMRVGSYDPIYTNITLKTEALNFKQWLKDNWETYKYYDADGVTPLYDTIPE